MSKNLLRFRDLKARGIVRDWVQVKNLTDNYAFPKAIYLSANVRAWRESEIDKWIASRPETKDEAVAEYADA